MNMTNYISYRGSISFFDDTKPSALPPPGGAVFRRPKLEAWAHVPQIIGEYCTDSLETIYAELAAEREQSN